MKEPSELTIKLTIDASEALETLANVKAELEQIITLQEKIAELKVQVSERQVESELVDRVKSLELLTGLHTKALRNVDMVLNSLK